MKIADRKSEQMYDAANTSSWLWEANALNAPMNGSPNLASVSLMPVIRQRVSVISLFSSFIVAKVHVFFVLFIIFIIIKLKLRIRFIYLEVC